MANIFTVTQQVYDFTASLVDNPISVNNDNTIVSITNQSTLVGITQTTTNVEIITDGIVSQLQPSEATYDKFSGNGVRTLFTLTNIPLGMGFMEVDVGGVTQIPGDSWTLTNTILVQFSSPPPTGTNNVVVQYWSLLAGISTGGGGGGGAVSWETLLNKTGSAGPVSIALGQNAGSFQNNTIGLGVSAAANSQASDSIAIGTNAGRDSQGTMALALGNNAGRTNQQTLSIAIGPDAGFTGQNAENIALGVRAGSIDQNYRSIAIGYESGKTNQNTYAVSLGNFAGKTNQGVGGIAIGSESGQEYQQNHTISIGSNAGYQDQNSGAVAIGYEAGRQYQGTRSVAIGYQAARNAVSAYSVSIGNEAGRYSQTTGSIVISAGTTPIHTATNAGLYIKPIRVTSTGTMALFYNTQTSEIQYGQATGESNASWGLLSYNEILQVGDFEYKWDVANPSSPFNNLNPPRLSVRSQSQSYTFLMRSNSLTGYNTITTSSFLILEDEINDPEFNVYMAADDGTAAYKIVGSFFKPSTTTSTSYALLGVSRVI